jgi:hypothetical protein
VKYLKDNRLAIKQVSIIERIYVNISIGEFMNIGQGWISRASFANTFINTRVTAPHTRSSSDPNTIRNDGMALLDSSAIMSKSIRLPNGDWISASVSKHENHTERNPLFIVRGTYANGDRFEAVVDINRVSPFSMNFVEMMGLDGHFATLGKPIGAARSVIGALGAGLGAYNIFTKIDGIKPLEELMVFQRANRNFRGFSQTRSVVDTLTNHMAQRLRIRSDMEMLKERSSNIF